MSETAESTHEPDQARSAGRIVVGVDGSEGSINALAWALREARLRGVDLHAIAAWSYHASWDLGSRSTLATAAGAQAGMLAGRLDPQTPSLVETEQRDEADVAALEGMLETAIRRVQMADDDPRPVAVTSETVEGPAAKVLLDNVSAADLLVVGTRGHGAFVGALLGSVSHHVVAQAPCPVVVVPARPSVIQP